MNRILLTVVAVALASTPALAQKRKRTPDRVVLKSGAPIDGTVQKDTWQMVVIRSTAGGTRTLKPSDVERVVYGDQPPAFRGAMESIRLEKWAGALSSLGSAQDWVESAPKDPTVLKPGKWFAEYIIYWRGYCLLKVAQTGNAIRQFDRIRKEYPNSRFLVAAYEQTLEALRITRNEAAMAKFEKEIDKAPSTIRTMLKANVEVQRAELLYNKKKYRPAKILFEKHARSSNSALATQATMGVIRCLSGLKDAKALERYVKGVISSGQKPELMLIASNALGDVALEKKNFSEARAHFVDSVVKYNPGRKSSVLREHERAIYQLAQIYETLSLEARAPLAKKALKTMAARTYRELSIEYASGRWYERAAAKAKSLEPRGRK